jgi:hypothetical protein
VRRPERARRASDGGLTATWEIRANLGPYADDGVDARGWLWEIGRGAEVARVVVEISGPAWSADRASLPEDTRRALETDGRSALLDVLEGDGRPRVIRCGSNGCYQDRPRRR